MFETIVAGIAKALGGQVIGAIADGYKTKVNAGVSHDAITQEMVGRELAVQQREIEAQQAIRIAQTGVWYTPENMFAYVLVVYFSKCILFDKVVASIFIGKSIFSTDPIQGELLTWAGMIMLFLFGKRGFENIARIMARK
jgi:hypothetical protein